MASAHASVAARDGDPHEDRPESLARQQIGPGIRVEDRRGQGRPDLGHGKRTAAAEDAGAMAQNPRVDSGKKKKMGAAGGAVAAGLRGGGKSLVTEFHVTADMTRKVYRDLKKPMASG